MKTLNLKGYTSPELTVLATENLDVVTASGVEYAVQWDSNWNNWNGKN